MKSAKISEDTDISVQIMYKKAEQLETESENFELPFGGKLAEDNRWVIMAKLVPWSEVEEEYAKKFTILLGVPAKSSLKH